MRKTLFRGKSVYNNQWTHGDLMHSWAKADSNEIYIRSMDNYAHMIIEIKPETLGQYIGLYDKNGEKIFEGDICDCNDTVNHYLAKVVKDIANPDFVLAFKNKFGYEDTEYDFVKCGNMSIKVIGKLYDNPELV